MRGFLEMMGFLEDEKAAGIRELLEDEKAAAGLITAVILLLGGIVGLYISFILVGELSDVFTSVYSGNNTQITEGINSTTSIVLTVLRLLSIGLLAWGGFMILGWMRGE